MEKLKSYVPINFELASNPVNWIIVALMVLSAGVALAVIFGVKDTDINSEGSR